jgi:hypothetical protein
VWETLGEKNAIKKNVLALSWADETREKVLDFFPRVLKHDFTFFLIVYCLPFRAEVDRLKEVTLNDCNSCETGIAHMYVLRNQ